MSVRERSRSSSDRVFLACFTLAVASFLCLLIVLVERSAPEPCEICVAAGAGELERVRALAAAADPGAKTRALVEALSDWPDHQEEIVSILLAAGADAKATTSFRTPGRSSAHMLELAVARRRPALVKLLVEHGADVRGEAGGFALLGAAEAGSPELVRVLLDAGAPASFSFHDEDALARATRVGDAESVRLLREHAKGGS
jgi:ankyrin repeat protein